MIVKELKKIIKNLPDDMEVGGRGHFNEFLEILSVEVTKIDKDSPFYGVNKTSEVDILYIDIEDMGPDPEEDLNN